MSMENNELIESFVEESNEGLADIENDFLAIEEAGSDIDHDLVNKVFRCIHSIKGTSGFLGLKAIGALAHEMENILNMIRNDELVPSSRIVDALLQSADVLRNMVNDVENSNDTDISGQIELLKNAISADSGASGDSVEEDEEIDIELPNGDMAFMMVSKGDLLKRQKRGEYIHIIEADLMEDLQAKDLTPVDFLKKLYNIGELIDSYVSTAGLGDITAELPDSVTFRILASSKLSRDELSAELQVAPEHIHEIFPPESKPSPEQAPEAEKVIPKNEKKETKKVSTKPPAERHQETSVRVHIKLLDTLMSLAGELVLGRNQLLQVRTSENLQGLESVTSRLDQVTSELQEAIMQTRLQPVGTVFSKFPRLIRDMNSKLGKNCELTIEGKDVELDKTIIESIGDPLTHMVRNSIDHGVETPEERQAAGKSPQGTIILSASHQGGKVCISIQDDGKGIDAAKLREKAVAKGILTPDQAEAMNDREAVNLIFHPGFSMAEKVTEVSGRGVGMDVVKTNISKLGGTIDIDTEVGVGTNVSIHLPLTLAIIPSLIVRCGDGKFAIPQVGISELVRVKASEMDEKIQAVKNTKVLRFRDCLLPLIYLEQALQLNSRKQKDIINIIVLETGRLRYGLVVDSLCESEEIVVKPLGRHLKSCECFAGATILGDGKIALILDISGIASYQNIKPLDSGAANGKAEDEKFEKAKETITTLLFAHSENDQFGVPMGVISRIERIRREQIDSVGGKSVLQYRGTSLPLIKLEEYIKAEPMKISDELFVVVFRVGNQEKGLMVSELVDITEINAHFDSDTFREPGVDGSTIINGKTTRMINLLEMDKRSTSTLPASASESRNEPIVAETTCSRILLAEDSTFFRNQVISFLEAEGFEVTGCEDGLIAWNTIQKNEQKFDLIVTDIEMPNMNGYEFAEKVKQDSRFREIPIIAVTSLAGEDDIKRGKEVGINEYHIKLERETLIEAVKRILNSKPAMAV